MIPNDPVMLMSFMNMKLRDAYDSPEALCEDLDLDLSQIEAKLAQAGFTYDAQTGQYR